MLCRQVLLLLLVAPSATWSLSIVDRRQAFGALVSGGAAWFAQSSMAEAKLDFDAGDGKVSATQASFLIQLEKTNARLEQSGYKLDTREEEASRLADALGSFSYSDSTSEKKTNNGKTTSKGTTTPSKNK